MAGTACSSTARVVPTGSFNSANYWVDVLFDTTASDPPTTVADTTSTDFSAGTGDAGVFLSETTNGEIILAPAFATEFSGATLATGWSATPWNEGGTAAVTAGRVTVDGARVSLDDLLPPGQSLEFAATFSNDNFQHAGFALTLNENLWATFQRDRQRAPRRTHDGVTPTDTSIPGSWLGSPHRFSIDWGTSTVVFWIDGNQVASVPSAIATDMRPTLSDYNHRRRRVKVGLDPADALRDRRDVHIARAERRHAASPGPRRHGPRRCRPSSSLTMSARFGNTAVPDASWTPFTALPTSGGSPGQTSQYVQYRAGAERQRRGDAGAAGCVVRRAAPRPTVTVADASVVEGNGRNGRMPPSSVALAADVTPGQRRRTRPRTTRRPQAATTLPCPAQRYSRLARRRSTSTFRSSGTRRSKRMNHSS